MTTLSVDIPTITTDRLILRAPREADLAAMIAFGQSERSKFVGGPYEPWQSWGGLIGMIGHWVLRGYGWWMLESRADGRVAGRVGVGLHHDWPEPELGWHLYDGFEGQGLGYEAALAARDHATRVWGMAPLISMITPDNIRSRKLAERLGARIEREDRLRGKACLIYRHPSSEPEGAA